jgi:L-cysteine:1D-myo-inositol 2-amino-2-deoxy-alpha-D-glucopyranoside ligase
VTYVQNVTDVDDPLLERANRDGEDWRELADREIARYRRDMEALRVLPPARLIGAVEALPLIERMNQVLADRGALYEVDGDVYFSRARPEVSPCRIGLVLLALSQGGGDPVEGEGSAGLPGLARGRAGGRPGTRVRAGRARLACGCAASRRTTSGRCSTSAGGSDLIFAPRCSASARAACGRADQTHEAFARVTRTRDGAPGREKMSIAGQPGLRVPPGGDGGGPMASGWRS